MSNPLPEDQLPPVPNHCRVWNYNGRYVLITAGGEFEQLCEHDSELLRAIADWLERANGVEPVYDPSLEAVVCGIPAARLIEVHRTLYAETGHDNPVDAVDSLIARMKYFRDKDKASQWKKQSETPAPPGERVLYRGRCYGEELRNWEEWMEVPK